MRWNFLCVVGLSALLANLIRVRFQHFQHVTQQALCANGITYALVQNCRGERLNWSCKCTLSPLCWQLPTLSCFFDLQASTGSKRVHPLLVLIASLPPALVVQMTIGERKISTSTSKATLISGSGKTTRICEAERRPVLALGVIWCGIRSHHPSFPLNHTILRLLCTKRASISRYMYNEEALRGIRYSAPRGI